MEKEMNAAQVIEEIGLDNTTLILADFLERGLVESERTTEGLSYSLTSAGIQVKEEAYKVLRVKKALMVLSGFKQGTTFNVPNDNDLMLVFESARVIYDAFLDGHPELQKECT